MLRSKVTADIVLKKTVHRFRNISAMQPGPVREIFPGGTKADTCPPSFWGPRRILHKRSNRTVLYNFDLVVNSPENLKNHLR